MTPSPVTPPRRGRHLAAGALTLLFVWLPALVGGVGIDSPARPGEVARVEQALRSPPDAPSTTARMFYGAALPADPGEQTPAQLLGRARLASVIGLFGISGLLYLLLAVTRRRTTGLLACLWLALLPPVYTDGAVLRPEVPAALFGGLAVLLLVGFPLLVRQPRSARRWVSLVACMIVIGVGIGLAASCVSAQAVLLLIPGGCMLLILGTLALQLPRMIRRRTIWLLPTRAIQRRVLPWVLLGVVSMLMVVGVLDAFVGDDSIELPRTPAVAGLLPAGLWAWVLFGFAFIGALRLLVGVGLRLGRQARVKSEALLLIYVAVMLAQRALGDGRSDALMAAPALTVLLAEGAGVVVLLVAGRVVAQR